MRVDDLAKELRICSMVFTEGKDYRSLEQIKQTCAAGAAEIERLWAELNQKPKRPS